MDIERDLRKLGISISDYEAESDEFKQFLADQWFPEQYHGGRSGAVWDEKHLEHWIAGQLLGLASYDPNDVYVDIAAGNSPWAKKLRDRLGISACAIDLAPISDVYSGLPYYWVDNATCTCFDNETVRGVSLHCAYEMFVDDDDTCLITELARILKPGGKAVILPLYMHTHYCAYATPEFFRKGYADPEAKEYIRMDCYGVPSSRKYDAITLQRRVLEPIQSAGMKYRLMALRNKESLGRNIYCHFILEIEK
ncbi:MAG: class I SAM-dependent methyltransferase [Desulfatirhabdiaceae bacterium]